MSAANPKPFTKEMVERTIMFFNDTSRVPDGDQQGMEKLIESFVRFESVVQAGHVEPGEAMQLARGFVSFAREWFQKNPAYQAVYQRLRATVGR